MPIRDRLLLGVLVLDAVMLAIVELFYLPERFDGRGLPDLGGWPFPITVVLAAASTPWLVARAGEVSGRALVVGSPLWAWLLTVGVVGLAGPGGDLVLALDWRTRTLDWRTYALLAAGVLPAAVVLGNRLGRAAAASRVRPSATGQS